MPGKGESNAAANHQRILLHLLNSVDENKYCVDCDAKGPRWASWNLGIFLCIRCAGIHRNLGVHISKVKSVNLDSWTAEQIESVLRMGNKKAREIYEAQLPPGHRRPQEDYALEQFIRNKYDKKMYADTQKLKDSNFEKVDIDKYIAKMAGGRPKSTSKSSGGIPAPPSSVASTKPTESIKSQKEEKNSSTPASNATPVQSKPVAPKQNVDELLSFGSPSVVAPSSNSQVNSSTSATAAVNSSADVTSQSAAPAPGLSNATTNSSNSSDLAGLVFDSTQYNDATSLFNQNNAGGDLFGSNFVSEDESSKSNTTSGGKKTNQDILSLYKTAAPPSLPSAGPSAASFSGAGGPFPTGATVPSAYQWNQTTNTSNVFPGQSQTHNSFSQQSNFGGFNTNGSMVSSQQPAQQSDFFNNRHSVLLTHPASQSNFSQGGAAPTFTSQFNQMNLGPMGAYGSASPGGNIQVMPTSNLQQQQPFTSMSPSQMNTSSYNNPFAPLASQVNTTPAGLHLPPSVNSNGGLGVGQGQHGMVNWNMSSGGTAGNSFAPFNNSGPGSSFGAAGGSSMMNGNNSSFGMGVSGGIGGFGGSASSPLQATSGGQFSSANNMFSSPFAVQSQQNPTSMTNMTAGLNSNANNSPFSSSSPFGAAGAANSPFNHSSTPPSSFNPYHSTTSQQSQQPQSLWLK